MKRKPEDLLLEAGRVAFTSNLKPSTAALVGIGSLVAISLIEKYAPKVSKVVGKLVQNVRLAELPLPVPPGVRAAGTPPHPEGPAVAQDERQEGRSEVIRAIARGTRN